MSRYDVVVLGGGIIGCALAEELATRGHQRVALIERGAIGGEASKAAAGILSAQMDVERPDAFFELCQASRRLYPAWVKRLEARSKISVGYHVDGILYLAVTADDARKMEFRRRWQRKQGLQVERWSKREITRHEPNVDGHIRAGFFFPTEAQLDNVTVMEALAVACRRAGVEIHEGTEGLRVATRHGVVVGVHAGRRIYHAPVVVNCLGSWVSLGGTLSLAPPVVPAKGQMLAFEAPKGLFRHAVMSAAAYGVQRRDGRLIVGSTVEFVGFDKRVTLDGIHRIVSGFRRIVKPDVFHRCALIDSWAGLRPCSHDRLPILGPGPIDGLYFAVGHFRHGILLAPITAKLLTEHILTGRSSVDLVPFSIERFLNPSDGMS